MGMIEQESSWNPYAIGDGGAAYGFGQLHAPAAQDVNADRFDPTSNLYGSAAYLRQQYNRTGNWTDALAAYNQGYGNYQTEAGAEYAATVMDRAGNYGGYASNDATNSASPVGGTGIDIIDKWGWGGGNGSNTVLKGMGAFTDVRKAIDDKAKPVVKDAAEGLANVVSFGLLGGGWFSSFKEWIKETGWIKRFGFFLMAVLLIFAGLMMIVFSNRQMRQAAITATKAAVTKGAV